MALFEIHFNALFLKILDTFLKTFRDFFWVDVDLWVCTIFVKTSWKMRTVKKMMAEHFLGQEIAGCNAYWDGLQVNVILSIDGINIRKKKTFAQQAFSKKLLDIHKEHPFVSIFLRGLFSNWTPSKRKNNTNPKKDRYLLLQHFLKVLYIFKSLVPVRKIKHYIWRIKT